MRRSIVSALLVTLAASSALAAEAHAEAPSLTSLFLPVVNFAIFLFVFARYAWPLMRDALVERRKLVQKALAEADRASREAKATFDEIEAKRAGVQSEGRRLLEEMRAEAERERQTMLGAARQGAERIRSDASLLAEQEAARAAQAIREHIANEVIARVSSAVRERLTEDDERRFVGEFVGAVEAGDRS
jgi:F-type H+-transporting ATPase subunit b